MKKICMEFSQFSSETLPEIKNMLLKTYTPFQDIIQLWDKGDDENIEKKRKKRREVEVSVWDFMTALMVCHNVTPVYDEN